MGLSAHGHRSQHPGTAPARCLHSHRAPNGTATVGPTPLQETHLFGWEPDHLGRVRVPVWLNLPVATILRSYAAYRHFKLDCCWPHKGWPRWWEPLWSACSTVVWARVLSCSWERLPWLLLPI